MKSVVLAPPARRAKRLQPDPLWYKDAVVYQVHVRAFFDSDGDGIGDFRGLTSKLDYIEQLGVTALWLLPFYPSPLRDEGYDIADYTDVHPDYGTVKDFAVFLGEAHRRGLRVITELVLNHTSDQHAWFQHARRAKPGTRTRDYYVWSDTPTRYPDARIVFKDFEQSNWTYDPVAKAYYWHRFYSHQPDLNYENPSVRREVLRALDFWLELGVDGFRLDAVPYLYEQEGTDCENLPQTHAYLKELRRHVDQRYPGRVLLAEANQWPEDAVAYFGEGDECNMCFHFPLMPRLFMGLQMEDRFPILDILRQTPEIPPSAQWAIFLRNHDELTLEMVTDEERDYMYRAYAIDRRARINLGIRRRLDPLLGNDRRAIELLNALLFSLPGTPVVYYGDELGMGDNFFLGDRNGVRTPMQWSSDRNAGFSRANPQSLYLPVIIDPQYHYEAINVEAQNDNRHSLLWWMREAIAVRKRHSAFGRGSLTFLEPRNGKVLAFVRRDRDDVVLVVANLSRFAQHVELDLSPWSGARARELFGGTDFPPVGESPWPVTLGGRSFYWFRLTTPPQGPASAAGPAEIVLDAFPGDDWPAALLGAREALETTLAAWIPGQRWFGAKAAEVARVELREALPLGHPAPTALLALVLVHKRRGEPEQYLVPLARLTGAEARAVSEAAPQGVIARLRTAERAPEGEDTALLADAVHDARFRRELLEFVLRRRAAHGLSGGMRGKLARNGPPRPAALGPGRLVGAEQSNTSILYDDALVLKLYRRIEEGVNPDLEIGAFLTSRARFPHVPALAGWIDYEPARGPVASLVSVSRFVPNQGDAWSHALDVAERFLERAAAHLLAQEPPLPAGGVVEAATAPLPAVLGEASGPYFDALRVLGRRTAEMHLALAADGESPDFRPERFTPFARRALYQSVRGLARRTLADLRAHLDLVPPDARTEARELLELEDEILRRVRALLDRRLSSYRIRTHGDFHLGQVLRTGHDFVIIDFEGEPAIPIGERRIKRSPLRDVAGMLRSLHYAAHVALGDRIARRIHVPDGGDDPLRAWARAWYVWSAATYLAAYLAHARKEPILAEADDAEITALVDVHRLEKAIYELDYELNSRPTWIAIPLAGIRQVLSETLGLAGAPKERR